MRKPAVPLNNTTQAEIERAAAALKVGRLVAFPTETVYGLGADATNVAAVRRIFEVKGRPADHPLILHLASAAELPRWASTVPEVASQLAAAFWPGPLTLVVAKSSEVPRETTGGLASVGLRVPAHPVALELLRRFGGAVAAPSANRFGRVSPTRAEHVVADLGDDVEFVLDGGPCSVGLESTIIDVTSGVPVLLRPGGVTIDSIEALLGVVVSRRVAPGVRAPGMLLSHYAPQARVELVAHVELAARAHALKAAGESVAVLLFRSEGDPVAALPEGTLTLDLGENEHTAARLLYWALREADTQGASVLLASPPVAEGLGEALTDRLTKAAGGPY